MREEIKNWWGQAKRDLQTAKNCYNSKDYYASAFFCHRSVEKGLKALYLDAHKSLWKIHDLVKLAKEVDVPEKITVLCSKLNPFYIQTRYPEEDAAPADKIKESDAQKAISLAEEVLKWLEKAF